MAAKKRQTAANWRHYHIGRHLGNALRRFDERVVQLICEAGYNQDRLIFHTVTRYLDIKGTRLTELARRANMTKQAMSELVEQVRKYGIVEQRPDPTDRRARLIVFSAEGMKWLKVGGSALRRAEREMRDEIGPRRMAILEKALFEYGKSKESLIGNGDQQKKSAVRRTGRDNEIN